MRVLDALALNAPLTLVAKDGPSLAAEMVLQRLSCTRCLAKGCNGRLGRGYWVHAHDNQSGRALSENRWVGWDT